MSEIERTFKNRSLRTRKMIKGDKNKVKEAFTYDVRFSGRYVGQAPSDLTT